MQLIFKAQTFLTADIFKCVFFTTNMLLFCRKSVEFVTKYQNMNFSCGWYFLNVQNSPLTDTFSDQTVSNFQKTITSHLKQKIRADTRKKSCLAQQPPTPIISQHIYINLRNRLKGFKKSRIPQKMLEIFIPCCLLFQWYVSDLHP